MRNSLSKKARSEEKYYYRYCCATILTILAAISFFFTWYNFVKKYNTTGYLTGRGNLGMAVIIYGILFIVMGKYLRAFKIGVDRKMNLVIGTVLTCFTVAVLEVFISLAILGNFRFFWKVFGIYIIMAFFQSFVLGLVMFPMINVYRKHFPALEILEVYGEYKNSLNDKFKRRKDKYKISKLINYEDGLEKVYAELENYDAILINDIPSDKRNELLKKCYEKNKRVYFTPKISDIIAKSSEELNLFDTPLCLCKNLGISNFQLFWKRFFDVVLSGLALIVLSPILLIVAIAIHAEDGGPVFFKQERVTLGGKRFMILKFRSMIVDAEKDGRPHPAGEKDDRITKVGNVIRATRIDELPQLWNIFRGDMSIVGPRPERWEHDEKYTKEVPEWPLRLKVKGGLTGYAQVYGKYNTTALDKLKLDLFYITNYSLVLDVQIIFETLKIVLRKDSTEGFTEEKGKEMHDDTAVVNGK
ncbi:sugar transferase [Ruminococcus sp. Marseille-P328]|uniref:sugar transferase n=1 Tax=Ruminococcus sp. Marseille-P328 TaxID=1816688 RepID=UPI00356314CE